LKHAASDQDRDAREHDPDLERDLGDLVEEVLLI
jgi:hypothetical protein